MLYHHFPAPNRLTPPDCQASITRPDLNSLGYDETAENHGDTMDIFRLHFMVKLFGSGRNGSCLKDLGEPGKDE